MVISAESGGEATDYLYGLERIAALNGKNKTEYAYDGRGSVAAELRYTDAWYTLGGALSKADVTSKSYTPFGEQIGEAVSGFGYNGEYYNANTGMVYLRARFYEPEMNRFSQKDILRGDITVPNSLNSYAYVQNDPVNYCDPSGMRQVKGIDASGTSGSIYSVKKSTTSAAATMAARAGTMAYMYSNEARMNGSAAAAKKAQQAIQQSYSYANEARMNGNGSSVYKTYGALQAVDKQTSYTNSRGSETVAEATPKVGSPAPAASSCSPESQYAGTLNSFVSFITQFSGNLVEYVGKYSNGYWVSAKHNASQYFRSGRHIAKVAIEHGEHLASVGSKTIPYVGAAIDFAIQYASGETFINSAAKALAHLGIGAAIGIVAGVAAGAVAGAVAAAGAAAGVAALAVGAVFVGSAILTTVASNAFDKFYDKHLSEKVNSIGNSVLKSIFG